jgi:hypothetical protein
VVLVPVTVVVLAWAALVMTGGVVSVIVAVPPTEPAVTRTVANLPPAVVLGAVYRPVRLMLPTPVTDQV